MMQGVAALLVVGLNTIAVTLLIFVLAIFKLLIPVGGLRSRINRYLSALGELWVSINKMVLRCYRGMEWDIEFPDKLDMSGRYLVFCNHNSWADIMVMQYCLNRRAPFMRFLLKQQLIWVPFLGFAWWALDMAFLRRYSPQQLLKDPLLRGKDLENAAKACEKLKHIPVSMMTFPEGTRFTEAKREQQKSPYRHLLRPRFGGVGQVLYSFGDALDALIDVTIIYPAGTPTFWEFISGQPTKIKICVRLKSIDDGLLGANFREDPAAKVCLKTWLEKNWADKDQLIDFVINSGASARDAIRYSDTMDSNSNAAKGLDHE